MHLAILFPLTLLLIQSAPGGYGTPPATAELSQAHAWAEAAFTAATPAFSFSCKDRPAAKQLGGWETTIENAQTDPNVRKRSITFTDPKTRLEVHCAITEYTAFPAVEWMLTLRNRGEKDTPLLENIHALDCRAPSTDDGAIIHYQLGDSNGEKSFAPQQKTLTPGNPPFILAPKAGRSSEDYLPFINIARKDGGIAMAIGWSGQWQTAFDYEDGPTMRITAGQQTSHLRLHPGESIRTPRMLLVFWNGNDPLRGSNLMRQVLMAHYLPRRNGQLVLAPICGSVTQTDPDGTYEGPHIRAMKPLAKRGVEVFWSDMDPQQWYPGGFPDGTGTWEPDLTKYPNGLKPIGDAAHAAGLEYLLWFEPERVAKKSRIAREHPEWVSKGMEGGLFKLHIPEARAWITDYIDQQVTAAQIDWMRWDFNIQPLKHWQMDDAPDRQGITENHYIEGLYTMWDAYRARHPGLVIDLCASGGRRIDLESLMRGLPLWHSDMHCFGTPKPTADQLQNAGLYRWVPFHGSAMFDLEPSYSFRSNLATGNILVPLCGGAMSEEDPPPGDPVLRSVALYKKIRPYFLGDFYPLFPHDNTETVWFGYQFHRADLNQGLAVAFRREQCTNPETTLLLHGLDPARLYELRNEDEANARTLTGQELAACAVTAPTAPATVILYYKPAP